MAVRRAAVIVVLASVMGPGALPAARAGAEATTTDRAILDAQRSLRRYPSDATAHYRLGDAYIRKARETGDVAYFVRAEAALRTSLTLAPRHGGATRHLAYLRYSVHDFAGASALATTAVELDPSDGHAYGILGTPTSRSATTTRPRPRTAGCSSARRISTPGAAWPA
jgi:cytochrome c-type biogenesis protein CcmH/NrfG